jgi:RNA polymerase sigma-B factor
MRTSAPAPLTSLHPGDLEHCTDRELLTMVHSLERSNALREQACEILCTRYQPLVRSCVQRYKNSAETQEELMQVGYVGLLKAINNFDPAVGTSLAGYAQPCVSGEIKRHFRDKRWQVRVKRSLQELRLDLREATGELTHKFGRIPTDAELASHLDITEEDVREARRADMAFQAASLDSRLSDEDGSARLGDLLGEDDPNLEHVLDMESVWAHWEGLPDREQQMLLMRFYGNMTQAEIGKHLGVSQMHVSRLLAEALGYLREHLSDASPHPARARLRR